jgi:hypothetical protein
MYEYLLVLGLMFVAITVCAIVVTITAVRKEPPSRAPTPLRPPEITRAQNPWISYAGEVQRRSRLGL